MKKFLIAFLISLSCACVAGAVGCKNGETSSDSQSSSSSSSSSIEEATLSVDFVNGEGYTFRHDIENGTKFCVGDILTFSVDVSVFYTGYPVVEVNGVALSPESDGSYRLILSESTEITLTGIQKAVSNMAGTGAFDDAFVVTSPIDLLYIAEQVNKGVEAYATGAYILANDIDCGGEELQIIGDYSTENSVFRGCFTSEADEQTGNVKRHTISNFVIHSQNANYVGLFGAVYADFSVQSSGLFYGVCLNNFTINASVGENANGESNSIIAGGLIGYGVGANIYLCDVTNGELNVYSDTNYFSFAGGLIGYQQAFYDSYYDNYFASEIVYSKADVNVRILSGTGLYAGGLAGYLATNVATGATAFIHNSYATGDISGALRSGGLVGGLGQYTSVSNSYATGGVYARAVQSPDFLTETQYADAYAGGLVGYAENDTIVNDCFFDGEFGASSAYGLAYEDTFIAGGDKKGTASAPSKAYIVENCTSDIDLSDTVYFTNLLGWGAYDWSFVKNEYPTVNFASPDNTVFARMQIKYVTKTQTGMQSINVNGQSSDSVEYFNTGMSSTNIYAPIGNYIMNGLTYYYEADNGYLSYGYFFDEACTQSVPYGYVPQKNITLYVGFADPTPILGEYLFLYGENVRPLSITFDKAGYATYTDGATTHKTHYQYDGESIIVESARLARYYQGEIVIDENNTDETILQDAQFDIYRYEYYDFLGFIQDNILSLYDGKYFTKDAPLSAKTSLFRGKYYTADKKIYTFYGDKASLKSGSSYTEYKNYTIANGVITLGNQTVNVSELIPFDAYAGVWEKSATVNKTYSFDGMGNWSYAYKRYVRNGQSYETETVESASGVYTVNPDGSIAFTQKGVSYTARFNADGALEIIGNNKTQLYYAQNSFAGTWNSGNTTLILSGLAQNGLGKASVDYGDNNVYDLVYEYSETNGYIVLFWTDESGEKSSVFGYYTYNINLNALRSVITDPNSTTTGFMETYLCVLDDYNGEWISNSPEFLNAEFSFNGNGLYPFLYGNVGFESELTITIDGVKTTVTYTLDSTQEGSFAYNGVRYTMTYLEDKNAVILTSSGLTSELERKDELAGVSFVDKQGNSYVFDGRSNLSTGGILTVNENVKYVYKKAENGWTVYKDNEGIGNLTKTEAYYSLTLNQTNYPLYLSNPFMGEWAIGGEVSLFIIGPTDLNGKVSATFKEHAVTLTQMNATTLTFSYREDNMPITYYVYVVEDNVLGYEVLVLSQYTNLFGDYTICTKANEFYGEWKSASGFSITFDGVTSGAYANGSAFVSKNTPSSTPYFYSIKEKGIVMWSQGLLGNKTLYYKLTLLDMKNADLTDKNVFVKYDENGNAVKAFLRTEVDGLYLVEAKAENGEVYLFDGLGTLYLGNEAAYEYKITAYNPDNTANLILTDKNGKDFEAILDYSDSSNVILTIGDAIDA